MANERPLQRKRKNTYVRWTLTHLDDDKKPNKTQEQIEDKRKSNNKPSPKKSKTDSQKQMGKLSNIEKYQISKRTTEKELIKYFNPETTNESMQELLLTQENKDRTCKQNR
jgi:hypothetical protein